MAVQHMIHLTTRCGCTKTIAVPTAPYQTYDVPMVSRTGGIEKRTFKLASTIPHEVFGIVVWEYEEE